MAKFEVTLKVIEIYRMDIEAEDEDSAIEKGWERIETEEGKFQCHSESDGEEEAYEIGLSDGF